VVDQHQPRPQPQHRRVVVNVKWQHRVHQQPLLPVLPVHPVRPVLLALLVQQRPLLQVSSSIRTVSEACRTHTPSQSSCHCPRLMTSVTLSIFLCPALKTLTCTVRRRPSLSCSAASIWTTALSSKHILILLHRHHLLPKINELTVSNCRKYRDFVKTYNTYYGNCYSFNMNMENATGVKTTSKMGSRYGMYTIYLSSINIVL
jgi:hypothetical protein